MFITWQMEGGYVLLYNSGYEYVIAARVQLNQLKLISFIVKFKKDHYSIQVIIKTLQLHHH